MDKKQNDANKHIYKCMLEFFENTTHKNGLCDIQLTDGRIVTEVLSDIGRTIKVTIYEPNTDKCYTREFNSLSTKDQLTILKAIVQ